MIAVIAPWILLSLFVGFLGRERRGGFWGMLFFSILFTPVVGLLALLLAGQGKAVRRAQARQISAATRVASSGAAPVLRGGSILPALRSMAFAWAVLVLVFALVFVATEGIGLSVEGIKTALAISLDAGTFRMTGTNLGNGSQWTRLFIGLEGLMVLVVLALKAGRFAVAGHERAMRQMRSDSTAHIERLQELHSTLQSQQTALDQLRSTTQQAKAAAAAPLIIEHQA